MEAIILKLVPFFVTVIILAAVMAMMMAVGWVSGKLIRKLLGVGGK